MAATIYTANMDKSSSISRNKRIHESFNTFIYKLVQAFFIGSWELMNSLPKKNEYQTRSNTRNTFEFVKMCEPYDPKILTSDSTVLAAKATLTGPLLLALSWCGSTKWQLYDFVRREDDIHASKRNMAMNSQPCTVLKRFIWKIKSKSTQLIDVLWETPLGKFIM